jgi:hypothetical protein
VIDSPNENLQSLPQDAEALRALVLATLAERDAAVTERRAESQSGPRTTAPDRGATPEPRA